MQIDIFSPRGKTVEMDVTNASHAAVNVPPAFDTAVDQYRIRNSDPANTVYINMDDPFQLINTLFEIADHAGIAQFRVGAVTVTVLDLAIPITFSSPLPDGNYKVFFQIESGVSALPFPSGLRADGFTLNLPVGVAATFSYLAVGIV